MLDRINSEYFNLHQPIDKPTRTTAGSETLIDHIYVTTRENIVEVCSRVRVAVTTLAFVLHGLKKVSRFLTLDIKKCITDVLLSLIKMHFFLN